jgi:hypothetical protein
VNHLSDDKDSHMDVFNDPTFWGEAMITAASRLALLAAVVWVARMAVRTTAQTPLRSVTAPVTPSATPGLSRQTLGGDDTVPFRYIDLRRGPERIDEVRQPVTPPADPLRQRLLDYLEKRETERNAS